MHYFLFFFICNLPIISQVMSVKALGTSLKLTFEGKSQLIYPETWFFVLVVSTCVITQMNYLNKVSCAMVVSLLLIYLGILISKSISVIPGTYMLGELPPYFSCFDFLFFSILFSLSVSLFQL